MALATQLAAVPSATMTTLARRVLGEGAAAIGAWQSRAIHGGLGVSSVGLLRVVGAARVAGHARPWSLVLKAIRPPAPDSPTARTEPDAGHVLSWRREAHAYRSGLLGDLLDAGADIATVLRLTGHADVSTSTRYDRRGGVARRAAADLLHVPYARRRKGEHPGS